MYFASKTSFFEIWTHSVRNVPVFAKLNKIEPNNYKYWDGNAVLGSVFMSMLLDKVLQIECSVQSEKLFWSEEDTTTQRGDGGGHNWRREQKRSTKN